MEAGCVVAAVIENAPPAPKGEPGSGDVLERDVHPSTDKSDDDVLPQTINKAPPEERDLQEKPTAQARSDDISEQPAEPLLRSCVSTASMKIKNVKKLTFPRGHFPRLAECAHFHYETVDFGNIQSSLVEGQSEGPTAATDSKEPLFLVQITCQGRNWLVKRSYEDFRVLDKHLHLCIYDRRYSELSELPRLDTLKDAAEPVTKMLSTYLSRFSAIADNKINCGPVLTWMEIDNKGNHLLVSEEASINVPAIAAAHVTKRYTAQATDELTFEVGDIVSVIDMPPKEDTGWWRGKHGFQVGFFPCSCVELINDKIPDSVQNSVPKPVCKKHGKLITFLRTFMKSRPPPQKLRQRGILRERVFGCDLGEHLHNSGHEIPQVVQSCAEFIEKHGVVDGIYRLSGISSNIQKLRHEFDSEQIPDLTRDVFRQDIHSVGSLCKLYFRELPNPLLTYQLYDRFSEAVSAATDEERLVKIHNVIQQLPPPHYRTLEYLMRHLSQLATFSSTTNMHTKNLAIVWAPNLLRSRQIESACFSGTAAFMEVRIQSVVVEFILNNTEALFSPKLNAIIRESTGNNTLSRPKSLLVCSPSTKLLSLEEAQARTQAQLSSPATTPCLTHSDYIEVGEGPGALLGKFHTVIELPMDSCKRPPAKAKKSPVGNWLSFFHLGKSQSVCKRRLKRHPSEPNEIKCMALPGGKGNSGTLRSTKSEESLASLQALEGEPPPPCPRRPRSTSEAISAASGEEAHKSRRMEEHKAHTLNERCHGAADRLHAAACVPEDDLDLCPPAVGISSLDFDPMSFQCAATPGLHRGGGDASGWRKSAGCSSESEPISSPNNNNNISGSESPDLSPDKPISPTLRKKYSNASPPPRPSSSPPLEKRDAYPHRSPLSSVSQASALTDPSQSGQNLPDPGEDRLMSSVSVLPPHPPSMSAARKLALALAETAQKASAAGPQRRGEAARVQERPPRPSVLDLDLYPQECSAPRGPCASHWQTSAHDPADTRCCPHPFHFLPDYGGPELPRDADGQESSCNFTPNVSPLGSGSLDGGSAERGGRREAERAEPSCQSVGVSTPVQPVCLTHSPSTSPVYVNADSINVFNFRAVLAETAMPASVEEVLPHHMQSSVAHRYSPEEDGPPLESVYISHPNRPHPGRHYPRPDALPPHLLGRRQGVGLYRQSSESRYSTFGLQRPLSPQCVRYRGDEHPLGGYHRQQGPWQRSEDRAAGQPAIRRARSFHAPQVSRYALAGGERHEAVNMARTSSQRYQRLIQTSVHPVQPQVDSAPVNHRYAACPGPAQAADPGYYQEEADRQGLAYAVLPPSQQSDYYNCSPRRLPPVSRRFCRDSSGFYDPEGFGRAAYIPVQQGGKSRCKTASPSVVSPTDSLASPPSPRNRDIAHTRSKSDPGNACLLNASRPDGQSAAVAAVAASPLSDPDAVRPYGHQRVQMERPNPPLRKVPSLPERSCTKGRGPEQSSRSRQQDPAAVGYAALPRAGILRRSCRSQSTRENRHYHQHARSPLDPEHPGTAQLTRRTQSTKVRPSQHEQADLCYAAPRPRPSRSGKAPGGYLPSQGCMSPRGQRLLSRALGREAFHHATLRSEAGAFD